MQTPRADVVEKGGGGVLAVDHHVVGEADAERAGGAVEEPTRGGVLAIAGAVRLDIEGQREARADDRDQAEMVPIAADLMRSIVASPAQLAKVLSTATATGAVDREADEAGVLESLVSLGAAQDGDEQL